jgi:hypothetical protein
VQTERCLVLSACHPNFKSKIQIMPVPSVAFSRLLSKSGGWYIRAITHCSVSHAVPSIANYFCSTVSIQARNLKRGKDARHI